MQVIAQLTIQAGKTDQALELMRRLTEIARASAGNLRFELLQHAAAPERLATLESWSDVGAADAHMSSPPVGETLAALGPLLAAPPVIERFVQRG